MSHPDIAKLTYRHYEILKQLSPCEGGLTIKELIKSCRAQPCSELPDDSSIAINLINQLKHRSEVISEKGKGAVNLYKITGAGRLTLKALERCTWISAATVNESTASKSFEQRELPGQTETAPPTCDTQESSAAQSDYDLISQYANANQLFIDGVKRLIAENHDLRAKLDQPLPALPVFQHMDSAEPILDHLIDHYRPIANDMATVLADIKQYLKKVSILPEGLA